MYNFVPFNSQDAGSQDSLGVCIYQDLHEAIRLSFFLGPGYPTHRSCGNQSVFARFPNLVFGQTHPAQSRIHVKSITRNPVGNLTWIIIKKVGSHNFKIIV